MIDEWKTLSAETSAIWIRRVLDQGHEPGPPLLEDADEAHGRVGQLGPVDDPPGLEGVVDRGRS